MDNNEMKREQRYKSSQSARDMAAKRQNREEINKGYKQRTGAKKTKIKGARGFAVKLVAALAATTIVITAGESIIGNLTSQANAKNDMKQSITTAANFEKFEKDNNQLLKSIMDADQENKLNKLASSVKTYEELRSKNVDNMQPAERQAYNAAVNEILSSSDLIKDSYRDIVKSKIAAAYGIKDIQDIKIKSVQKDIQEGTGYDAFVEIQNGDDTINIEQDDIANRIFPTNKVMPKSLSNAVIEAAEGNIDSNNPTSKEILAANVKTFNDELTFANGASYKKDNNGNLIESPAKEENKQVNNPIKASKDISDHDEER